ncbi:hypothetical protein Hanom_Chr11g01042831 [Helianthus anomalus]
MWLVSCSKKDIECLFFNKIMYYEANKEQALQYQKLVGVCFEKEINSGHYWKTNWRDLEGIELLKKEKHDAKINERMKKAAFMARLKFAKCKSIPINQTPVEKEEKKKIRLTKFFDYIDVVESGG